MTSRLFFACFLIGFSSIHGSPTYDVADFGAAGDNTTDDTLAFEAAIDAIAASGAPGTLLVPSGGVFLIRPINLTSNMVFHIQSGATVCGVMNDSLWPLIPPLPSYGQGRDHPGPRFTSLLHGERLENVTVSGDGNNNNGDDGSSSSVLDGQGGYWWGLRAAGQEVLLSNCSICVLCQTEVSYQARNWSYYGKGAPVLINSLCTQVYTRGSLVEFMWCRNVTLQGLTLRNSPFWTTHFFDCDEVIGSLSLFVLREFDFLLIEPF